MSELKTLFAFRFNADLDAYHARLIKEATNMRIGDVENLWKDTPGRGRIAPGVGIHLWRPSGEPNDWQIDATAQGAGYDTAAVEACRQRLLELLPRISVTWREIIPGSAAGVTDGQR
ncbi:hypothetical protein GWI34_13325 [Actinomadura sp. DSM 109109]|nr:hypothetical protein [Actinomadura lepetitiana]